MKKILMATDGSEHSEKTIAETIRLAGSMEGEVTVITVMEEAPNLAYIVPSDVITQIKVNYEQSSKTILTRAEQKFKEKGIEVKTILVSGHPADEICRVAKEGNFDIVVLGSRGMSGIKELFLGSVSNKVAHCAKPSVYIVK
ncbi:MAG: universal stress protein [Bacillota bacterium]